MVDPPSPLLASSSLSPASVSRLIPALPDDLAILCIARVPRSHHPCLAAVSRAWRTALSSPLLFSLRLEVGASQHFLLINVRTPNSQSLWYLLDRLHQNSYPTLIPLPDPPIPVNLGCAVVTLGHSLFLLGGSVDGIPSPSVQIYDARFNCWRLGAPMIASREFAAAGAISGRIYAVGGCHPANDFWAEEFDPEMEEWKRVPSPPAIREKWMHGNAVIGGKLLAMSDHGGVVFEPAVDTTKTNEVQWKAWGPVPTLLDSQWRRRAAAVGEVIYSYDFLGKIKGYDLGKDVWITVEGVDKELPKVMYGAALTNFGEVLCLVWEGRGRSKELEIICAGIRVIGTNNGGLQGSVEWSETITLAIPKISFVTHCISMEF